MKTAAASSPSEAAAHRTRRSSRASSASPPSSARRTRPRRIATGTPVTLSCAEGETGRSTRASCPSTSRRSIRRPLARPRTKICSTSATPSTRSSSSLLPSDGRRARAHGVRLRGLGGRAPARAHALRDARSASCSAQVDAVTAGYADKTAFFVDRLSQGHRRPSPRPSIRGRSSFASATSRPTSTRTSSAARPSSRREENPMLGWRGASRYYHPGYKEGFLLECRRREARARDVRASRTSSVMIPFCRTPEEGDARARHDARGRARAGREGPRGLRDGRDPSNILLADRFAEIFDGFSIGSNDLTQLTLGVDRDSTTVAPLFDERNEAVKWSCAHLIEVGHAAGARSASAGRRRATIPSSPRSSSSMGFDSISLSADALLRTTLRVLEVERALPTSGASAERRVDRARPRHEPRLSR